MDTSDSDNVYQLYRSFTIYNDKETDDYYYDDDDEMNI